MSDFCRRCEHAEDEHNDLGLCEVPHCRCVCFVSDSEEEEDDDVLGIDIEELDFDEEA